MSPARCLDRIDVANQISNRHVRRSQLFHVALLGTEPRDRRRILLACDQFAAAPANWRIGTVVNLASRYIRHLRIEQARKRTQDAAFRLPAQTKKNKIMTRQDCIYDLRHHRIVVTNDPGKNWTALAEPRHQVLAQLVFDSAGREALFREWTFAQLAESLGNTHGGNPHNKKALPG